MVYRELCLHPEKLSDIYTVSSMASYQHWANLSNADLEGDLRGWGKVRMMRPPAEQKSPLRSLVLCEMHYEPSMTRLLHLPCTIAIRNPASKGLDQLVNFSTVPCNWCRDSLCCCLPSGYAYVMLQSRGIKGVGLL